MFSWLNEQLPQLGLDVAALSETAAVKECVRLCEAVLGYMSGPAEAFNYVLSELQHFMSDEEVDRLVAVKDTARKYAVQLATTLQADDLRVQQLETASEAVQKECERWQQALIAVKMCEAPIALAERDLRDAGRKVNKRDREALKTVVAELKALLKQDEEDEDDEESEEEDEAMVEEEAELAAGGELETEGAAPADAEMDADEQSKREDEVATNIAADRQREMEADNSDVPASELIFKLKVARMKLMMR